MAGDSEREGQWWQRFALAVAVIPAMAWGGNFVVAKIGFEFFGGITLTAVRFLFIGLAVLWLGWPKLPFGQVALYALLSGVGQYTLSTLAMKVGLSAGLASLVMQTQVFFSAILAFLVLRDVPRFATVAGLALGFGGLMVLTFSRDQAYTPAGLALIVVAAASWACANLQLKLTKVDDVVSLQVAAYLLAFPVVACLGFAFDPVPVNLPAIAADLPTALFVVVYMTAISLFMAQAMWGWLLGRFSMTQVTPFSLLVPVFGITLAYLVLGETLNGMSWLASAMVFAGLLIHIAGMARGAFSARTAKA